MSKKSNNVRNAVAAVVFGLSIGVALIEIIPRLLPSLMPGKVQAVQRIYSARTSWEDMMRGDRELGFVLKPGLQVRFPSEGREIEIRTADIGVDGIGYRDIGTHAPFDAIALGDSFTFCDDAPAENCWVRLLAEKTGLSIADLGVNGYSNLAEARMLDKVGRALSPKLVLVGFFPNDFKDNVHFHNWTESHTDDYWTWMRRKRRSDVSDSLARNSILYRLIDAARRYGQRTTSEYKEDGLDFVFRADAWWSGVVNRAGVTPTYELTEQALDQLTRSSRKIGAELVVVLFPFKEQVYWDIARHYHPQGAELEQSDVDSPLQFVADYLAQRGVKYCNLAPVLRAKAKTAGQLYLRAGAHFTDAGNEAAAQAIADCLKQAGVPAFPS